MTHPKREELARRLEVEVKRRIAIHGDRPHGDVYRAAMHEAFLLFRDELAAEALRQSPSVEEVRAILEDTVYAELAGTREDRAEVVAESLDKAAQAIVKAAERPKGGLNIAS